MTHIDVTNKTQRIEIDPVNQVVQVGAPTTSIIIHNIGPPGPPGPPGNPGGDLATMNFTQAAPSDEWIINHNFGFYPSVSLFTVGGNEMLGQVVNISVNQVRVYFSAPVAGTARLS